MEVQRSSGRELSNIWVIFFGFWDNFGIIDVDAGIFEQPIRILVVFLVVYPS